MVVTTTAMVVTQAVPRAVEWLTGMLVEDTLNVLPLTDTARGSAEARGVQTRAAPKTAAALSAGSCTVQDSDWPPAMPPPAHNHASRAMRAGFFKTLCMEVLADQKRRQGSVLAITLGEAQRAAY